ncbi:MAG TPA: hypothetical protein VMV68_06925 [Spirochaetia bacterium]|nr:hypothetical protein [Spirochaetia bacterium]
MKKGTQGRALVLLAATLLLLFAASESAFARGGFRGGGFRSSAGFRSLGGYRSYGRPVGSAFGWGRATRSPGASAYGRSAYPRNTATAIGGSRLSAASERTLYSRARQSGTTFATREEAAAAFQSKHAGQYPSRFAAQPSARPTYIPATTTVGGRPVNIVYSPAYGGYGYMDPSLGHWVFYNALANTVLMNSLMASNYYWWGPAPMYGGGGAGFFTWAIILFVAFMVLSSLLRWARRGRQGW